MASRSRENRRPYRDMETEASAYENTLSYLLTWKRKEQATNCGCFFPSTPLDLVTDKIRAGEIPKQAWARNGGGLGRRRRKEWKDTKRGKHDGVCWVGLFFRCDFSSTFLFCPLFSDNAEGGQKATTQKESKARQKQQTRLFAFFFSLQPPLPGTVLDGAARTRGKGGRRQSERWPKTGFLAVGCGTCQYLYAFFFLSHAHFHI